MIVKGSKILYLWEGNKKYYNTGLPLIVILPEPAITLATAIAFLRLPEPQALPLLSI